ncbi:TetR/AcrR family transcriptional regulator [Phenylobacterium sp. J367]|uniref:TetR/AcrR family transcriptional regulator n=1 Tax=Phenylobacterium sp. J367 TaxID=2898435 RepID=UPI002150C685|nr:TetR/AcrR family transcriptional regulator [Phenylobacterium sp. J367]MCR5879745.1 TetR/AcrR family transcriptional regulator [Phenylobacterium sp. J367]
MRYSDTHKEETRKKVLKAAAGMVRSKGPDGVSVAELMAEVGLTHGGFYAHFANKEALVAAAVTEAFEQSRRRFVRMTETLDGPSALNTFIDAYVSEEHRANPQRGCPVAALASDLPRQGAMVRKAFDSGVNGMIERLAAWLPNGREAERKGLATSMLAEMAGAVSLARAVSDDKLAGDLLAESRNRIKARVGLTETPQ